MKLEAITNVELSTSDKEFVESVVTAVNVINYGMRNKGFSERLSVDLPGHKKEIEVWRLLLTNNMDRMVAIAILNNLVQDPRSLTRPGIDILFKLKTQLKLIWENSVVVED